MIVAEYDAFVLMTAYVPNAGEEVLVHLKYRQHWDEAFCKFLKGLASCKPLYSVGTSTWLMKKLPFTTQGNRKNAISLHKSSKASETAAGCATQ